MPSSTGLPVDLGREQLAQQVVAGVLAPVLQLPQEVVEEALGPVLAPLGIVGELQHVAHPAGERVGQVGRDTEDPGDDPDRDLLRVVGRRIGVALSANWSSSPRQSSRVSGT